MIATIRRLVLLAGENQESFSLIRSLLEGDGYEVLEAHNGQETLDLARRELPDLILMELSLIQMDGWNAVHELKTDLVTAIIPLLALTTSERLEDRNYALRAGFNGFIFNPVDRLTFQEKINRALKIGQFEKGIEF